MFILMTFFIEIGGTIIWKQNIKALNTKELQLNWKTASPSIERLDKIFKEIIEHLAE